MIERVWDDRSTWNKIPHKFEGGTPNVEAAVGLGAAIARAAAVNKRMLYHYFGHKDDLFREILRRKLEVAVGHRRHVAKPVSATVDDLKLQVPKP